MAFVLNEDAPIPGAAVADAQSPREETGSAAQAMAMPDWWNEIDLPEDMQGKPQLRGARAIRQECMIIRDLGRRLLAKKGRWKGNHAAVRSYGFVSREGTMYVVEEQAEPVRQNIETMDCHSLSVVAQARGARTDYSFADLPPRSQMQSRIVQDERGVEKIHLSFPDAPRHGRVFVSLHQDGEQLYPFSWMERRERTPKQMIMEEDLLTVVRMHRISMEESVKGVLGG